MSNVWQDIKDRLSVEEVIQEYIPVISQGGSYKAVCPFHREKSPSLIISSDKRIWHCFGCGAGGDVFAFVTQIENITKKEALEKLAKKAGVKLEKLAFSSTAKPGADTESINTHQQTTSNFQQGLKLLEWSGVVYHKILLKVLQDRNNPITQYCLNRGLTQEIIQQFKLGYAPKGNFLLELVKKHGISIDLMLSIGVLKNKNPNDSNNPNDVVDFALLSDKFADRLMIPVFNRQAQLVGFTGRVLPYDKSERPKYLNSPQTDWFNKSDLWYGWNLAKAQIIQAKKALIVEGNMDVVSGFKHGFEYTLASQGTSFTETQLKVLKTITRTIWLAFDNDEAGKISSDKFFKSASGFGFTVYKVLIPLEYKDLDDYLSGQNPDKLEVAPYLDWILNQRSISLQSTDSTVQKNNILSVLDLMQNMDALSKEQYLKKLSEISKISINTLQSFLLDAKIPQSSSDFSEQESLASKVTLNQLVYSSWQNLLATILVNRVDLLDLIKQSYILLSKILPQFIEFVDFDDYLVQNTEVLNFIIAQKPELSNLESQNVLWKSITYFLDNHITSFILDQNLKDIYLNIKGVESLGLVDSV
jgi:DNA primase